MCRLQAGASSPLPPLQHQIRWQRRNVRVRYYPTHNCKSYLCKHARLNLKRLARLILLDDRNTVVHSDRIAGGFTRRRKPLDSGRWADDEGLLERLSLSAQLSGPGLQGDAGLGQARDIYGGLLVKRRLVVEERYSATSRLNLKTFHND